MNLARKLETASRGAPERLMSFVRFLSDHYFRTRVINEDDALETGRAPVIFAANHSGMNFPWDCFVLLEELRRRTEGRHVIRPLSAPVLLKNPLMSPFALPQSWNHFSAPATMASFESIVARGHSVMINPEGIAGIGKGFNKRYRLQAFSSSFVRMCLKYDRPLVPISVVNGEYLNPFAYSFGWLNRLVARFGIPFLPIGPTVPLFAIFPVCAYIALPARLRIVIGKRLRLKDFTDKAYDDLSREEIRAITERIRAHMQEHLDRAVHEHGAQPFAPVELWRSVRALGRDAWKLFPLTWSFQVHRLLLGDEIPPREGLYALGICAALCAPVIGWPALLLLLAPRWMAR